MFTREKTRPVKIGKLTIGGGNLVRVQSMTQTKTSDVAKTVKQINDLTKVDCEIIRVTVPDTDSARAISAIKKQIGIPLVCDIHFQYLLAIEAIKAGADKIRINPGNIGGIDNVKAVVLACKGKNIPIRIGVNMGSLEKDLFAKYGKLGVGRVMVESATRHVKILEGLKFFDIVVSLKGSDNVITREANMLFAKRFDYPLHIGITEAGTYEGGAIKSAVGIGSILAEGIGDTIRVSISDSPGKQVKVAWDILKSLKLRQKGVEIIACPTCGRTEIDLTGLAKKVEKTLSGVDAPIKVAVMGCVVNGPGEASFADIGICGGNGQGAIFREGRLVKTFPEKNLLAGFLEEFKKVLLDKGYKKEIEKLI